MAGKLTCGTFILLIPIRAFSSDVNPGLTFFSGLPLKVCWDCQPDARTTSSHFFKANAELGVPATSYVVMLECNLGAMGGRFPNMSNF